MKRENWNHLRSKGTLFSTKLSPGIPEIDASRLKSVSLAGARLVSMSRETDAIRTHLDNLLRMEGAHISFDDAVAGFPANLCGEKPAGAPHSAWELLEHMRIAQEDILDFSRNPEYVDKTFPDDYWPKNHTPPSEEAWDESISQFQSDLRAMRELIADPEQDLYARIPHGTGQTLLREAMLVADHNAYHLGQLMFLRKLLGV